MEHTDVTELHWHFILYTKISLENHGFWIINQWLPEENRGKNLFNVINDNTGLRIMHKEGQVPLFRELNILCPISNYFQGRRTKWILNWLRFWMQSLELRVLGMSVLCCHNIENIKQQKENSCTPYTAVGLE